MNKRQAKKNFRKTELFISSFASSYKEVRKLDRSYKAYINSTKNCKQYEIEEILSDF